MLQVSQPETESSQQQDSGLVKLMDYLKARTLPDDPWEAKVIMNLARKQYFVADDALYYERNDVPNRHRLVVPKLNT